MTTQEGKAGYLRVPLAGLAVGCAAIALTSLATLVVVASIKDVEALSTVALSLAVIAFVAQLIVFVVQTGAASQQMLQSRELHAELLRLLGEMGERAKGTEAAVTTINERLLEAALGKALGGREGTGPVDPRAIASQVASMLNERAGESLRSPNEIVDLAASQAARERLLSYPTSASPDTVAVLETLSPQALGSLRAYGQDEVDYAGRKIGPGWVPDRFAGSSELISAGLLEPRASGSPIHVLSEAGREAARLLLAPGDPPPHLDSDFIARTRSRAAAVG